MSVLPPQGLPSGMFRHHCLGLCVLDAEALPGFGVPLAHTGGGQGEVDGGET